MPIKWHKYKLITNKLINISRFLTKKPNTKQRKRSKNERKKEKRRGEGRKYF